MSQEKKSKSGILRNSIIGIVSVIGLIITIVILIPSDKKQFNNPENNVHKEIKEYYEEMQSDVNIPSEVKDLLKYKEDVYIRLNTVEIDEKKDIETASIEFFSPKNLENVFYDDENMKAKYDFNNIKVFEQYVSLEDLASTDEFFAKNLFLKHYCKNIKLDSVRDFFLSFYDGSYYTKKDANNRHEFVITFHDNVCRFLRYELKDDNTPALDVIDGTKEITFVDSNNDPIKSIDFFMVFMSELLKKKDPVYND